MEEFQTFAVEGNDNAGTTGWGQVLHGGDAIPGGAERYLSHQLDDFERDFCNFILLQRFKEPL
jgi:hypothetical protein